MLSTKDHRTAWNLLCTTSRDVLPSTQRDSMWCYGCNSVRNRYCTLVNLLMNVNHYGILLLWMCSWMKHAGRYIRRVKCPGLLYCLLLAIGNVMIIFILANRMLARQPVPSSSLSPNRRTPSVASRSVASFP